MDMEALLPGFYRLYLPSAWACACRAVLALANSILRRGEDERDVKNGMTSFTFF
jgi:hypothetical protein